MLSPLFDTAQPLTWQALALPVAALLALALAAGAFAMLLRLRRRSTRLATAFDTMSQGLCMYDSAERLVICNRRYLEMYDLSPEVVKPGCSFRDVLAHRVSRGNLASDAADYREQLVAPDRPRPDRQPPV